MDIKIEPFKTREQIANELGISTRYLYKMMNDLELEIPPRKRIPIKEQVLIYSHLLGERCLRNTAYEKYLKVNQPIKS